MAVPRINLCSEKKRQQVLQAIKLGADQPGLGPKSNLHKALWYLTKCRKRLGFLLFIPKSGRNHIHQQTHFLFRITGNCFNCLLKSGDCPDEVRGGSSSIGESSLEVTHPTISQWGNLKSEPLSALRLWGTVVPVFWFNWEGDKMRKTHHGLRERDMVRLASWLNYLPVICYRTKCLSSLSLHFILCNWIWYTYFLNLFARTQNLT